MKHNELMAWLALMCTCVLWASAFVLIKPLVAVMLPGQLAVIRYGIAALIMLVLYVFMPNRSQVAISVKAWAFVFGFVGIGLYNLSLNQAEITITASTTAFIIGGLGPLVAVSLSILFLKERLNLWVVIGMLFCVTGLTVMTVHHWGYQSVWGLLFAAIAASCGGSFSVMQKPLLNQIKPFEMMAFAIWGGFAFLMLFEWHDLSIVTHLPSLIWWKVVYLAVFPAVIAYSCWSYGIRTIAISRAVSVLYLIPVVTALIAWLMGFQMAPGSDWLGGIIIVFGAVLINNRSRRVRGKYGMDSLQSTTS